MKGAASPVALARIENDPFGFTDEDFRMIAEIIHDEAGIELSAAKSSLVYARLTKRLRSLGIKTFREYCALIADDSNRSERQQMIASLTTNVTRFFREPHHFDHLAKRVIQPRLKEIQAGARLRIWSSACSSGQEPLSIAMTILSLIPNAHQLDIRILATDIDHDMIAAAKQGIYDGEAVDSLPAAQVQKWFVRQDGGRDRPLWKARDELTRLVAFKELNLIGRWPMRGRFDAIFCRNVMIYFGEATQKTVWSRFADILTAHGVLYIGHSERLSGPAAARFVGEGVTTFRLKTGDMA